MRTKIGFVTLESIVVRLVLLIIIQRLFQILYLKAVSFYVYVYGLSPDPMSSSVKPSPSGTKVPLIRDW